MAGFGNNLPMMQMQMQQLEQQRMMLQQQMQAMNGMQQPPCFILGGYKNGLQL